MVRYSSKETNNFMNILCVIAYIFFKNDSEFLPVIMLNNFSKDYYAFLDDEQEDNKRRK